MPKEIDLSEKQTVAWDFLEEDKEVTEVFYGGAAGGGKSFFGCLWQIHRRMQYEGTRGLIGRSELKNLKKTTLKTFFDVAKTYFGMTNGNGYVYKEQKGEIIFDNGSEITLQDLKLYPSDPDFNSLGSLEISDVFIDECTEITLKAFEIVNSRIRYKINEVGGAPKTLLAGNPANNWVKHRYVLDKNNHSFDLEPHQVFVPALVDDNPDEEFKRLYRMQLSKLNKYDKARLLHGDWIVNKNEQPFFYEFDRAKHVVKGKIPIKPYEPLWLAWDFNINPCTVILAQKILGVGCFINQCHQVNGGTRRVLEKIAFAGSYMLKVTGDRSGNSGNSAAGVLPTGELNTDFSQIKEAFRLSDKSLVSTQAANPRHKHSRDICNTALFRIPYFISEEDCQALITDIETAMPTKQGGLLKDRDKGHPQDAGDAFRYLNNAWWPEGMKDINKFADAILT